MHRNFSILLLCLIILPKILFADVTSVCRRLHAHLLVGDFNSAFKEAKIALNDFPEEKSIFEMALKCYAHTTLHDETMDLWDKYAQLFPEDAYKKELLEVLAWEILERGKTAFGLQSQLISVIGAALTQDRNALSFLLFAMRHSNAAIRSLGVQLSSHYGDYPLKKEISNLFQSENNKDVKIELIKAIGKLRIDQYLPDLINVVGNPKSSVQEKRVSIDALFEIQEEIPEVQLMTLIHSNRAGLRQLACEIVAKKGLKNFFSNIVPLVFDSHPEVQTSALICIGMMHAQVVDESIWSNVQFLACNAVDPQVGVAAAWALLIANKDNEEMRKWLESSRSTTRLMASGAIVKSGEHGIPLAKEYIEKALDPYVKVNLAISLVGQREDCSLAAKIIDEFLKGEQGLCEMKEEGYFSFLQKSTAKHNPLIPEYPEVVNQTTRLKLLNLLAILEYPGALDSIKFFLKKKQWLVTGLAAELLLGEGDENAIYLIKNLLDEKDLHLKIEAALLLATWGRDPEVIPFLLERYPEADRDLKIKILESLGRIGDRGTIPFLVSQLRHSSQVFRMIAACILIQILNH